MPDFNKGDFTQQGVAGHVNANIRLNEKRLVNIDLTSDEEAEGCTIAGTVTDLLNEKVYAFGSGGDIGNYPMYGPETELISTTTKVISLSDTTYSSWTPTNSATSIRAAETNFVVVPANLSDYVYTIKMYQSTDIKIKENTTLDKIPAAWTGGVMFTMFFRPGTAEQWSTGTFSTIETASTTERVLTYYSNGSLASVTTGSYGPMYIDSASPTTVLIDGVTNLKIDLPNVKARCNDNYFATTQAANIEDATFTITFEVYQTPKENSSIIDLINSMVEVYPLKGN